MLIEEIKRRLNNHVGFAFALVHDPEEAEGEYKEYWRGKMEGYVKALEIVEEEVKNDETSGNNEKKENEK
jgi:hypothetical protein